MNTTQLEFNLDDRQGTEANLKIMQAKFTELTNALEQQSTLLRENLDTIQESKAVTENLILATTNMSTTIKNIYTMLTVRKELFTDDKEMQKLLDELATFTLSSGAIKLAAVKNALK